MAIDIESLCTQYERDTLKGFRERIAAMDLKIQDYDNWRKAYNTLLANWSNGGTLAKPGGGSQWYSGSQLASVVSTRDNYLRLWNEEIRLKGLLVLEADQFLQNMVNKYGKTQAVSVTAFSSQEAKSKVTMIAIPLLIIAVLFFWWKKGKKQQ